MLAVRFAAALLVAAAVPAIAFGQSLTDAQRKVYDKFLEAGELNDSKEMANIARRYKTEVEAIFEVLEQELCYSDEISKWEEIKAVGRALDELSASNQRAVRMTMVGKLALEQRQKRNDAINNYAAVRGAMEAAAKAKDAAKVTELLPQLEELAKQFEGFGDAEYQAYALCEMARGLRNTSRELDAVKSYEVAEQALSRAGYRNYDLVGQVKAAREELKQAGFDPSADATAKGGEGTAPKGNTGTSWAKDAEGERYSDPIPLKLVVDEKLPWTVNSPSPTMSENTRMWQFWQLQGKGPAEFEARFHPLGLKLKMRRAGVAVFMNDGESKEQELRVLSKPNLVEMSREIADDEGKKFRQKYAWLIATGADQESFFGLQGNSAPQPDYITLRYAPACYLKGKVLGQDMVIYDDNASGEFGDAATVTDATNSWQLQYSYADAMTFGKAKTAGPFTEYIEANGAFYRLKLQPDGSSVRTRKLAVDSGFIKLDYKGKVPPTSVIVEETREFKNGFFAIGKTPVRVPVGEYRLAYGIIRQGKKASEQICLIFPGEFVSFRVDKDETETVTLGEPFEFDFKTKPLSGGGLTIEGKSVIVRGSAGEIYAHFHDQPPIPEKVLIRVKGSESPSGKAEKMPKATFEDYQKDGLCVWQPLDLNMPGASDKDYEANLYLKDLPLLGGPIKSAWKN